MERTSLIVLVCLGVICWGCAAIRPTAPQPPGAPSSEAPGAPAPTATLASSHGPLEQNNRSVQQVREVFRKVTSLREVESFTAVQLQEITSKSLFSAALVLRTDLEMLKIFSAKGWVPVVVVKSPAGPLHSKAVIGYDEKQIILSDPMEYSQERVEYDEFSKMWVDPQKVCLLVFSQRVHEENIKGALIRYMPKEKVDSITIKAQSR